MLIPPIILFLDNGFIYEAIQFSIPPTLVPMTPQEKRNALGAAIRDQREKQGLSQARLALMIGSSKSHIWRVETGRVAVGIDDLGRIADALDTTTASLISF